MLFQGSGDVRSVEERFENLESRSTEAITLSKRVSSSLKRLKALLASGDVQNAQKAIDDVRNSSAALSTAIAQATDLESAQIESLFASDRYFNEISDLCSARNLRGVRSTQGVLFSYPYVVERGKGISLSFGGKTTRSIRPSHVTALLLAARTKAAQSDGSALLKSIEMAYDLQAAKNNSALVSVREIYRALTLRPGSSRMYSFFDFLVDLNVIDRHGPRDTAGGRTIVFSASTLTKSGRADSMITEDGKEAFYGAISFRKLTGRND